MCARRCRPHHGRAGAAAVVLVLMLLLFGGASATEPNHAGLVIQAGGEILATRCVPFDQEEISGAELLSISGLSVVMDTASFMGVTVCQIEGVGCAYPAEPCFCDCPGGGDCVYWNYFYRDPGGGEWAYSALGAAARKVAPGSVEAWVWGTGESAPPDSLGFEEICVPASPPPTSAPVPTTEFRPTRTAEPLPYRTATIPPAPSLTTTAAGSPRDNAPATPGQSSQTLLGYWPFGLMIVGLFCAGAVAWFRRK